jgi:hypothetical protein
LNFPGRIPAYGVTGEMTASTGRPKNGQYSASRSQVTDGYLPVCVSSADNAQ